MQNNYDDLIYNTVPRLPVCICIDTSASMNIVVGGNYQYTGQQQFMDGQTWNIVEGQTETLLQRTVDGINTFYDVIRKNNQASLSCEIAIVSFNDNVQVLENFSLVKEKRPFQTPTVGNNTNMGSGVRKALEILENRKNQYKDVGVDYYQPWLVIFTDGKPSDNVLQVQQQCKELEKNKKLVIFTFSLGDENQVDMQVLSNFSKRKPLPIKQDKIEEFFEWLGKSVSVCSTSTNSEIQKLSTIDIEEWAKI